MFLMWFDDDRRKTAAGKIAEGCAAYQRRFGVPATLIHAQRAPDPAEAPALAIAGARVDPCGSVPVSNFWIGREAGQ